MKGKLQFDLRRNHRIAGVLALAPIAVLAMLALAVPAAAQTSPDAMPAAANSAGAIAPSETFVPAAEATDAIASETFAPAAGAAIVAPDRGYALPPPDDGPLADPSLSTATGDAGKDNSSAADAAIAAPPAADETAGEVLSTGAPPIDLVSPLSKIAPIAAGDWDRVGDSESDAASGDAGNPVLEVPRAVPSPDASSGDGGNQSAQGGDSSPPDEVGSVDDYQDEDSSVMGVYITPPIGPPLLNPPFAAGTFGNQPPVSFHGQPNSGPMLPSGIGGVRPFAGGMNSAILPTSPMYPRGMPMTQSYSPMVSHSAAPIPGGWWNRAR